MPICDFCTHLEHFCALLNTFWKFLTLEKKIFRKDKENVFKPLARDLVVRFGLWPGPMANQVNCISGYVLGHRFYTRWWHRSSSCTNWILYANKYLSKDKFLEAACANELWSSSTIVFILEINMQTRWVVFFGKIFSPILFQMRRYEDIRLKIGKYY